VGRGNFSGDGADDVSFFSEKLVRRFFSETLRDRPMVAKS